MFKEGDLFVQKFVISKEVYESFIKLSNDHNPLHLDESFAKSKGFEGKVMHGNILNGFLSYFIGECLPVSNVIIHWQEIRFTNPAYLGDEVDFEARVTGFSESVNAVDFKFVFKTNKTIAKGKIQIGILK